MYEKIPLTAYAKVNPPLNSPLPKPACEVSFIPMQDVSDGGDWSHRQKRKLLSISSGYTAFQEGDILFAKITPCMENGKGTHAVGLVNGVGFGSTEFHVLRAEKEASPRFIFHLCNSRELRQAAEVQMTGSAGQKRVPTDFFSKFLVTRLNRGEQQAIAAVLDTMDEVIRQTETVIAKLRQVKAGMLHDLLTRGLDENGELRDPICHPEQFMDSPMGLIPKDWGVMKCGEICKEISVGIVVRPTQYYVGHGVPALRSFNIKEDGIIDENLVYISRKSNKALKKSQIYTGDVLTVRTGYPGTSTVVTEKYNESNCVDLVISRPSNKLSGDFLALWINSDYGKGAVLCAQGGLAQQHFNVGDLAKLKIVVPNVYEQNVICERITQLKEGIRYQELILAKHVLLKHGIMHDLLTGTIRVPQYLQVDEVTVADTKKV